MSGSGRVTLIGAGPGDPELITVLGLKRLRAADVVLHDRLAATDLLAEAKAGAEIVDVGKRPGDDVQARQRRIEKLMIERALDGAHVVRLKGGDPTVFGRGGEEIEACAAAGVSCEVVPGVSSIVAAPAVAGIPLTHRGVSLGFAVVSARNAEGGEPDWAGLSGADTVVVLMPARRLERIGRGLIAAGRPPATPVAVVERATTTEQRTVRCTLQTLAAGDFAGRINPPCVVIVGDVAARRSPVPRTDG
ncbi:MAG: uroporphyrinogen-III C-methyltransferase [Acidobacteriota bacterium]|nr:uroporphyrinogen-III C-methyltransferase [Acidobacteriota bacterium]MDE2924751.1 uroporphyrinogen-III C-methyltransferase [Acidobacteriota bacterium]MDE3264402.1 uroporphyrinogen-III C-methyltransferase [Acidobacteriota bacterium]